VLDEVEIAFEVDALEERFVFTRLCEVEESFAVDET